MTEIDREARAAVLALLNAGTITIAEATRLAGVSRQLMHYWVRCDAPGWQLARDARLTKLWRGALSRQRKPKP